MEVKDLNGTEEVPTPMSKTTTVSTIAVQSGKTRLVIALLHCGDWVQLKILEVTPELTSLGNTLSEALELQKAHDDVLRQLQNKQSPVEELLRQADQLISTQKPRAEVYAAMAESLGRAWKDVNAHLELRKTMLDLNVQYHTRAQEFFDRMDALEAACSDTVVPIEIDAVKNFLTNIHDLRRLVLESLNGALQAGNTLIGKLKELGAEGTLDSRPERIRTSVNRAISQVQGWMDQLHLRRKVLEITFTRRKAQLEQCLALALLAADLRELEESVSYRRDALSRSDQLGDSPSSAELLQHELKKLLPEGKMLQEKAIKITKATDQLVQSGCFAGEQATQQAYAVLSSVSDYLADLQHRDSLYERVIAFFRSAQAALAKLDQIEVQLKTTELPSTSPQLANLHAQCAQTIEEITSSPLSEGYALLQIADRGLNTSGIQRIIEELENRKISLDGLCVAHKEENRRINRELNNFMEKQNELYNWLVGIAEAFLQGHQDMGSDFIMAKDFLDLHNHLLADLQTKGNEINNLLLTLPPILEYLEDRQRHDVDMKVEALHERWLKLKNILESRLDLAALYVKFHTEAERVAKEMDEMESIIQKGGTNISEEMVNRLEERMSNLIPLYQSAKNTGLTFINAARKVTEPHLDTNRACVCVQSVLDRLAGRQLTVSRNWQSFHEEIVEKRETEILIETNIMESTKTITWVSKLDTQLYPVITTTASNPKDISMHIEQKQQTVLPEIKRAQLEVDQRIKTADAIMAKTPDEKTISMRNKLNEMNQRIINITNDYQHLSHMMIAYFNNLSELDKSVEKFNKDFGKAGLPKMPHEVDLLMRQFDSSKQSILNAVKFAQNECEEIVTRIHKQEPNECAHQDIEKLRHSLQLRSDNFEKDCRAKNEQLEAHLQFCQFDNDLQQINETLDDLSRQLTAVKGQYGESLATAKATSLAFVYFEKTIELLEQRIGAFVKAGEDLIRNQHVHSPQISQHIQDLQRRWDALKKQIDETRKLIDLSIKYFELVDEADEWFRKGSQLLVTIARRSTTVKHPSEAQQLLNEIEMFLKPGESKQDERIRQISNIGSQLFGLDRSTVVTDNREMMESFSVISNELNTLAQNLRLAEEQRLNALREQEEARVKLEAARAEAAAAQAAALAAEEARKAAEHAAKVLYEATLIQKKEEVKIVEAPKMEPPLFTSPLCDQIIEEGSKFTFICQVTGVPLPVVTWHKDGISIQNNSDYLTTFDQGLCTLTIEETFAEDSAKYTCKAINAAGSTETGAFLAAEEARKAAEHAAKVLYEATLIQKKEEVKIVEAPKMEPPLFTSPLCDQIIEEGSKFTFICQVTGVPLPVVTWHKDGISIQNNSDYLTTFDQGLCTLTIEETFAEDSAKYTCKAINAAGSTETGAFLSVKENEPEEQLIPPTFVKHLQPGMASEGEPFQFECRVEGNPLPTVQWYKNADCIDNSPDYVITFNNGEAILKFEQIFLEDRADYTCKAANKLGVAQSTANLNVMPTLEPTEIPTFVAPLSNVMARAGQKIKLECEVTGQPPPNLLWSHNGKPVKETRELKLQHDGQKATLVIYEAFPKDAGTYTVTASNLAGEASSACSVSVKGRLPAETSDSELASDMEPIKPSIQVPLKDISINEGNRVRLDCVIVGQPEPEVIWYHDDRPVKESPDFQLLFQGDRCSLIIQEALLEDGGEYKVVALNSAGEASSKAALTVTPVKSLDKSENAEELKYSATGSPPKFSKLLTDILVSEGDKVILEACVSGEPRPDVKWLLNNTPVYINGHINISHDQEGNLRLEINSVRPEDKGVYTVKASNPSGDAKCFAQLIVKSLRGVDSAKAHEEIKNAPVFKERFYDRSVVDKASTKFECIVTGKPTPKIRWIFNDQPVYGKNFLISTTSGDRQVLTIPEVTQENIGKITCVAENDAGKAECTAHLSVCSVTPPDAPDNTFQHKESSFTYKREINVQSSTSTSSKIISSSTQEQPQIIEHKHSTKAEKSFKQINQDQPEIKESHHEEEYHKINNEPPVIHEKSTSSYVIGSKQVETPKILPAQETLIQKSIFKSRPPKFITPVIGKIVDQEVDVVLEGILDGQPTPQVSWTKNGVELKSGGNVKVTFERNCARIEMKKVNINDAGRYTCTAINDAGKAISTADLVVKKTVFPPVFGRRLQAQVIKKGDRVKMEVEVTGTPDPEVTWYKDGQPLSEAIKDGYKTYSQGNSHTVIIEKADMKHTGKYMVRAINSGGEAQSIADIAVFEPTPDTMVEVVKTVVFEDVRKHETLTSAADKSLETITSGPLEIIKPVKPLIPESFQATPKETLTTEISTHMENVIKHDTKTLTMERTTPVPDIELPKRVERKVEAPVQIDTIDEGIQTSSISKQQSLDYFVKKLNQVEEVKTKEIVKPGVIKQEMYTKFEEAHAPKVDLLPKFEALPKSYSSFSSETKVESEVFNLVPEPPAEICYSGPSEDVVKEDVSVKVKRLEEAHKELSATEIPTGAVKIFPTVKSFSTSSSSSSSAMFYKAETIGPIIKPATPQPLEQMVSESTSERVAYMRPLSALSSGSAAEPNAEGIAMEKTWAHKHSECNVQKAWPPQQVEPPKIAPTWSAQSTLEKKWAPVVVKEEVVETKKESFTPVVEVTKKESFTPVVEVMKKESFTPVVEMKKQESFQKVEKSFKKEVIPIVKETFQTTTKTEHFEELPPPLDVPHYIAKVSHTHNVHEFKQESSFMEKKVEMKSQVQNEFISEDRNVKPSEVIKAWPPKPVEIPVRPVSVQDITDEIYLEPGTPPEIAYAPPVARKVETIEQGLEKTLEKPPTRVIPGAIRTIPPKKETKPKAPVIETPSKPFEKFPELEPFPFKPSPEQPKPPKLAPPPTPSKFIKGRFTDSDYESDFEAVRIPAKWKPYASDTEDLYYKHVNAPKFTSQPRSRSIDKDILPPSKFDQPPQITGPPRPAINFEACKQLRKKHTQVHEIRKTTQKMQEFKKPASPPLKPGTPPEYVQAEPLKKPQSPKTKHKMVVDGYMADTDEPFIQQQKKVMKTEYEFKQQQQQSQSFSESVQKPVSAPKITHHHKKHVSSSSSTKKKLVSTPIVTSEKIEALEPFPYKPDPPAPKSAKLAPPPSPSRFVKGEFKESDYESDYEGRIPPVWRSDHDMYYKPVRPLLTPTGRQSSARERTPTPPTEFDRPDAVPMPTRPKFEPIDKPKKSVKLEQIIKPVQPIFKPKPIVQPIHDVIIATPAVPEKVIVLQPGTPPELAYTPGPPKTTQYYRSTTSAPYHNAVQTETSNVMHFDESTDKCHRTVSVQQTTKVIKFGDRKTTTTQVSELEPFPYEPEPVRPRRGSAPPPPRPKKFVPGEFRESDYESEIESARIKSKWAPSQSDTEEPHYRKVRAPAASRSSSVPSHKERVVTPMEFDTQPPYQTFESSRKQMSKRESKSSSSQYVKSNNIQPGSPPEYGYAPQKISKSTATKIATQHMDSMTNTFKSKAQQFVSDVMEDVNNRKTVQKPILKSNEDGDGQVYREESRAAQYGTKHIDPDTGLIYFKYDFGYEFGVILPGESKNGEIPMPKKTVFHPPKRQQSIEMPVYHEKSNQGGAVTPQFQPKKFSAPNKNVKWEPTSESEMSEYEGDGKKKNKWEQSSCSPMSLSPSLPSTSPAFNNFSGSGTGLKGTETPPSCPSTPGMQNIQKRAPVFITPLRDIAVVSAQTARFECIVQSEPPPSILWSKNGRIIENSNDNQIFFRNGVCRLTIPKAFPEDAGTYSCTATNQIGAVNTTANLQVPGERRSAYI